MRALAATLRLLAFLSVPGGLLALWIWSRPADSSAALVVLRAYGIRAASDPMFLGLAGGAVVLAALARLAPFDAFPTTPRRAWRRKDPVDPSQNLPLFVDNLFDRALERDASDLHLEPGRYSCGATIRVDGELEEIERYPASLHPAIVRRVKILAELLPWQTSGPQDGRFALESTDGRVEVRVASVPSARGERLALRFSRSGGRLAGFEDLGMPDELLREWKELLGRNQGLLLLSGPTGSGKTTTLYASLASIHQNRGGRTRIATIEDPIEVELDFADQTPVNHAVGLDFASALKALLRTDPDVLMLGEIRDRATAAVVVEAGLSGHLVLGTLHAESSVGSLRRLLDLDIAVQDVASSVLACLSQRLVRRLCPECRRPDLPGLDARDRLKQLGVDPDASFFRSPGCTHCDHTGFRSRIALFDLLVVDREASDALRSGASDAEIARRGGSSLLTTALEKARAGEILLEDALRLGTDR